MNAVLSNSFLASHVQPYILKTKSDLFENRWWRKIKQNKKKPFINKATCLICQNELNGKNESNICSFLYCSCKSACYLSIWIIKITIKKFK